MGISIWQLLIILLIVALVFGTKKLRTIGGDLGSAVKGFRSAIKDRESESDADETQENRRVIEGEVESKEEVKEEVSNKT